MVIQWRLGSIMPASYYTRSMVQIGEVSSHVLELLVVKLALLNLTKNREVRAIHFQIDNTQNWGIWQRWEVWVFGNGQIKLGDMGLSSITWDHNYHRIPSKQTEHNCRQGIQGEGRLFRTENRPKGVSRAISINGKPSSRLVCISTKPSVTPVHSLETGPIQSGHRCDTSGLVSELPLCLHPFCLTSRILQKLR